MNEYESQGFTPSLFYGKREKQVILEWEVFDD
jgi:hypothetical protein